ncbi:hypothetical protein B1A99_21975 [Cohnella sp. CIP 111063]|uniref:DUF6470 family protein n=1 Tax=unclassified Cohnella TaxID=2636738 RepID=UPI000B8BE427|nr:MULTISPECIES: DUF6470 family protein [unclassified Cohnella]OXS55897.1 hypothetical protein B1A99_21975 [Cohnella sp. CIP 111063]PRX67099.1 hypothetical protein B0G52_115109 [Cohnella sp. SGD-V74]
MVPFLSIQSQRGLIGVESELGQFQIRRPKPELEVQSTPTVISATNRPGDLQIDQSLTNDALTGGKAEAFWNRVYSQYKQVAQQNIQHIVEKGNRMGDLTNRDNPIPELALSDFIEGAPDLQIFGFASLANVDFHYMPNDINLQVDVGQVRIQSQVHRPEIHYERGNVNVYMQQYPKVTITPPEINIIA